MRKLIAKTDMSLDGAIDNPGAFTHTFWDEEWNNAAGAHEFDGLVMGRRTYEGFAAAWTKPEMLEAEGEFATHMNTVAKYVVSDSLDTADWTNTTIVRRDEVETTVAKLKEEPGGNLFMYGYGPVAHRLLKAGLLDELEVWIYPVLSGAGEIGQLLFRDGDQIPLKVNSSRTLKSGVVILNLSPAERS
ncbi:MAG TPA: dihydrofolate reductase family protein [Actinophytocola sp.]|uniref:dihydrofolate reductase family protein n=1 Tax=Actinophytocola sp. TaxID=1872138 RepID=UPI002DBEA9BC|nr:dihydrofolate reductase family protein [Actinophytocola sp.]HEU5474188.1 dihydrofolate reductase family protein [Actinophytocola sp.]